jgi:hypothetical protein
MKYMHEDGSRRESISLSPAESSFLISRKRRSILSNTDLGKIIPDIVKELSTNELSPVPQVVANPLMRLVMGTIVPPLGL